MRRFALISLFLFLTAHASHAQPRLPNAFSDHAVLQRDVPVPVWGWADAGKEVVVSFKGQEVKAPADAQGRWRVDLKPMAADAAGAVLSVASNGKTVQAKDLLVGEVWLCSGQSNMEWTVALSNDPEKEAAAANWPQIRHIAAPKRVSVTPLDDVAAKWTVCSPQTVPGYTAAGYFFARKLHQELKVPVGLINCSWGGTLIEPWTPAEGFAKVELLRPLYDEIVAKDPASPAYKAAAMNYMQSVEQWVVQSYQTLALGGAVPQPPAYPTLMVPYSNQNHPTTLYNGMVHAFVPYALRGAIWYQGEANHAEGKLYIDKTQALVEGWRQKWAMPNMPYYYVQIAPFQYGQENPEVLAEFWEAQASIEQRVPHSGMVVVSDIGNTKDIHPRNKQDVGSRLAVVALKRTYGRAELIDQGPTYRDFKKEEGRLLVTFDHAGEGLKSRDGKPLDFFEIADEVKGWTPAKAEIAAPDTLALSAPGIEKPTAVRFAWHKLATPNLTNSVGLPGVPFRAGSGSAPASLAQLVPEASSYKLVYELDLTKLGPAIRYTKDERSTVTGPFDRVAYFLELGDIRGTRWVYVSMDAFTQDMGKIGIPTVASGAVFQQPLTNLTVATNTKDVAAGQGMAGHIEFWPHNYAQPNAAKVPGASETVYDIGDTIAPAPVDGYGSMQVHLVAQKQTVFAINQWKAANAADLGIGNNTTPNGQPDWTFSQSGAQYTIKRLQVLVRPKQ